jgi:hypothetical protein
MLEMKYFVLKPRGDTPHAEASREALWIYADVLKHYDIEHELEQDLRDWVLREVKEATKDA